MRKKKNIIELTLMSTQQFREMKKNPLILIADNVRSMHNIGSFFRSADAFAFYEIVLGGISGVPPHPEISKTALGAEQSVSWRHVEDTYAEVCRLKKEGWMICALEQAHGSIDLSQWHRPADQPAVIVVGNEVEGVDQRIVDIADVCLEIRQQGTKHSLNVSVSAGIAMFQALK